eukprot:2492422-Prymnesium_polylepis.1
MLKHDAPDRLSARRGSEVSFLCFAREASTQAGAILVTFGSQGTARRHFCTRNARSMSPATCLTSGTSWRRSKHA